MKFLKALLPALILALLLSGCSFRLFSTAEELIYPISPSGENANIQKALDNYIKNGYSLKTPVGGDFKTSYIFFDVDSGRWCDYRVNTYKHSLQAAFVQCAF